MAVSGEIAGDFTPCKVLLCDSNSLGYQIEFPMPCCPQLSASQRLLQPSKFDVGREGLEGRNLRAWHERSLPYHPCALPRASPANPLLHPVQIHHAILQVSVRSNTLLYGTHDLSVEELHLGSGRYCWDCDIAPPIFLANPSRLKKAGTWPAK